MDAEGDATTLLQAAGSEAIMNHRKAETALAVFSVIGAGLHFVLETLYHVKFGQFLPFLIVDYIADALLLMSAFASLRDRSRSSAGLLAGAWGFTLCLAYMACFAFVQESLRGQVPAFMVPILGVALLATALAFALSLYLARVDNKRKA